jgi:hypothetical protein
MDEDKEAMLEAVEGYDWYDGGGTHDYDVGIENMKGYGDCWDNNAEEREGCTEIFGTILVAINRIMNKMIMTMCPIDS